jgi:class 3 adenylate cyclase
MHTAESSEVSQAVEDWTRLCDQREASGNYLGACDAALLGLEQHPEARELQYRAVLNLSRIGANKRARQLWLQYRIQPNLEDSSPRGGLEENIAALGARLDREEAYVGDSAQRAVKLKRAAQHYEAVYKRSTGTFPGINAAVLHELSGNSARASELAAHVARESSEVNPKSEEDAYQLAADRAAANLLLGDLDEAQTAIEDAAALAGNAMAIASTRKQLLQICNYKGLDQAIVSLLRNRNVIHYTGHMITPEGLPGRFPAQAEAQVADRIRLELANHNVGYGYGSLACGADTLIVEALLDRGGEVSAVLPFEPDSFLRESVACGGAKWPKRFDKCLKQVEVIHATDGEHVGDPEVFAYASRLAMGLAIVRAQQLCSEVIQLAVWDGQETNERAGTFADVQVWRSHNLKTVTISSESNLPADASRVEQRQQAFPLLPPRKVRAILFGDFHGFSRLSDKQILTFYDHVTDRVASVIDKYASEIVARNTWGDGVFLVFSELGAAARCALDLQSELARLDFHSLGLPPSLGLRLGLDAGAVFEVRDPILKSAAFAGSHISRTARLEPNTPPGEVYVTEAFAALLALLEHRDLICEYVGMMKTPKNYGRLRTYLLRHRASGELGKEIGIASG